MTDKQLEEKKAKFLLAMEVYIARCDELNISDHEKGEAMYEWIWQWITKLVEEVEREARKEFRNPYMTI